MPPRPCSFPRNAKLNFPAAGAPEPPSAELLARLSVKERPPPSSQYRGVCLEPRSGRWVAQIVRGGRKVHLGCFATQEEAAGAYKDIDTVMAEQADRVKVLHKLEPIAVVKG